MFWIGTAVMLLFAFGVLFLVLFYQNYFIKMKRKEAELLLKASLESEKQERMRIAADLHDGVSGDLNAIRNYLSILQRGEKDSEKQELFTEIKSGVEAALENTRQVSYKLMPPLLELAGFTVALQDYFERLTLSSKIYFEAVCKTDTPDFFQEVGYELFRIIQELTTNMIKYGSVSRCQVIIYSLEKEYCIEITDDGTPFDFKKHLLTSTGSGLKNISSRLKVIDANMEQQEVSEGNHFIITLKK
ncbi:histidine kinase [Flavobacterium sp.]|uniref:sensor histidine kinase n=1 Tax=Flavobacterium sp. TaxID=239 RepID=UPI00260B23EF|nr:histidine kinase [Flavobacterium sp.]